MQSSIGNDGKCYGSDDMGGSFAESCSKDKGDDLNESSGGKQAKRKRISQACDACNKRKVKCDGSRPCLNCRKMGIFCTISRTDYRHLRAEYVRKLEDKLRHLEQQVHSPPPTGMSQPGVMVNRVYADPSTTSQPPVYAQQYGWGSQEFSQNPGSYANHPTSPSRSGSIGYSSVDIRVPPYARVSNGQMAPGAEMGAPPHVFGSGMENSFFIGPASGAPPISYLPNPATPSGAVSHHASPYQYFSRPHTTPQPIDQQRHRDQNALPPTATPSITPTMSHQHYNLPPRSHATAFTGNAGARQIPINGVVNYGSSVASGSASTPYNVVDGSQCYLPFNPTTALGAPKPGDRNLSKADGATELKKVSVSKPKEVKERKERSPSPTLNVAYTADATKFIDVGNLVDIHDSKTGVHEDSGRSSMSPQSSAPSSSVEYIDGVKSFHVASLFALSYERNINVPDDSPLKEIKCTPLQCPLFPQLSTEAVQELLICYFRYFSLYAIPLLRVHDVLGEWKSLHPFLVNTILMVGSRFARHPDLIKLGTEMSRKSGGDAGAEDAEIKVQHAIGAAFFERCRHWLLDAIESPTLETIIATIHCAFYHANIGKRAAAFMYFGMVTRMAIEMKLNDDRFNVVTTESGTSFVTRHTELRRRVFWVTYAMDRYWAILFERPLGIRDNDCYAQYPEFDTVWYRRSPLPRTVAVSEHIRRILHCPYVNDSVNKAMRDSVVPLRPSPALVFDAGIKKAMELKPELTLETAYQSVLQCSIRSFNYFVPAIPFLSSIFAQHMELVKIYGRIGRLIADCNKTKVLLAMDFSSWTTLRSQGVEMHEAELSQSSQSQRLLYARKRRILSNLVKPELTDLIAKLREIQLSLQMWYTALPTWIRDIPNKYRAIGGTRAEPPISYALLLMKYHTICILTEKLKHRLKSLREDIEPAKLEQNGSSSALDDAHKAVHAHEPSKRFLKQNLCGSSGADLDEKFVFKKQEPMVARAEFSTVMLLGMQFVSTKEIVLAAISTTEILVRLLDNLPETLMDSPIIGWCLFHAGSVHLGRYLQLMSAKSRRRAELSEIQQVIKRYIDLHLVCLQGAGRYWAVSWQVYKLFRGMVSSVFSVKPQGSKGRSTASGLADSLPQAPNSATDSQVNSPLATAAPSSTSSEPFIAMHDGADQQIESTVLHYAEEQPKKDVFSRKDRKFCRDDGPQKASRSSGKLNHVIKEQSPSNSDTFHSDHENGFENYQLSSTENEGRFKDPIFSSLLEQGLPQFEDETIAEDAIKDFAAAAMTFFNPEFDSLPPIISQGTGFDQGSSTDLDPNCEQDATMEGRNDAVDDQGAVPVPEVEVENLNGFAKSISSLQNCQLYPKMTNLLAFSGYVDDVSFLACNSLPQFDESESNTVAKCNNIEKQKVSSTV